MTSEEKRGGPADHAPKTPGIASASRRRAKARLSILLMSPDITVTEQRLLSVTLTTAAGQCLSHEDVLGQSRDRKEGHKPWREQVHTSLQGILP